MSQAARLACLAVVAVALLALAPVASAQPMAPPDAEFEKVTLNDEPGEPMDLAVLPDGRVLHVTRPGVVWLHDPTNGVNSIAAELDVYQHDEEGLQNVALDPNFERNRWVYLYYSPPLDTPVDDPSTPGVNEGDAPFTGTQEDWDRFKGFLRLSRFKFKRDRIDLSTEEMIIEVPVDRGICCHVGGDILFDADGNLYLSTGDDTNPFQSNGYTPIDERPDRNPAFDAQRSAGNTNDLRGKILRIHPKKGGGYTIPMGNLFAPGTPLTKPEIYVMGLRNPFRIEIDKESGDLYMADYSPDARNPNPLRGPAGHGKWAVIREPGNYGWPYCATAELPYVDYDFATGASGATFDCAAPVNESPHNTGMTELPPVVQPDVWYSYGLSAEFPELETGGIGPMAGPALDLDSVHPGQGKKFQGEAWPAYYDGVPLFYEWTRDYVKEFRLNAAGELAEINPVLDSIVFDNPMDLEFGRDGALYTLEYGDGFFSENPDAQLARIDYIGPDGNHAPQPEASADPTTGATPLTVQFSSEGTTDPDGDRLRYTWDFEGDGKRDSNEPNPTHTYTENGVYRATLNVIDQHGRSAATFVEIIVGNDTPVVEFVTPVEGQTFAFGDAVAFEVMVTDDQPVDCDNVEVTYILGHDEHGHPQTTAFGCVGTIQTTEPEGHDPDTDDLSGVFVAEYTDPGEGDLPALTGSDEVVLVPTG